MKTLEQANQCLEETYLVWWERELTVEPAHPNDAHRSLDKSHNPASSLSHVETRQVRNDYTIPLMEEAKLLHQLNAIKGLPYEPVKDGFVFSNPEIAAQIDRAKRLSEARRREIEAHEADSRLSAKRNRETNAPPIPIEVFAA